MTVREAIVEVLRMNGFTETQIKERVLACNLAFPGIDTTYPIKPGLEKEFIAYFDNLFRRLEANPKLKAEARAIIVRERNKARGNN